MEIFIAAYNKLDAEHCEVKSELAKVKRAQYGMKENLDKMNESISYGLSLIDLTHDQDNSAKEGKDYIKSALNPKVNDEEIFYFSCPCNSRKVVQSSLLCSGSIQSAFNA